jgi:hypothetical protein
MNNKDFTATLLVNQTAGEAFDAINNVGAWWSTSFEGGTEKLNGVFTVRFGEVFITSKVVELIPGKKIVWLVIDCNKPWLKNTKEWTGTKISWEISAKDGKTQILFVHVGLVPEVECFGVCSTAWGQYLQQSLLSLVTTGTGQPTRKESKVQPAES